MCSTELTNATNGVLTHSYWRSEREWALQKMLSGENITVLDTQFVWDRYNT